MSIDEVDTPALIVDLDALEANLDHMAALAAAAGAKVRPHAKTHKSPVIAHMQMARGAIGQCVQKVAEAEILAWGGVTDILVSNEVVSPRKLARLAALTHFSRIAICADDLYGIDLIEAAARDAGVRLTFSSKSMSAPAAAESRQDRTRSSPPNGSRKAGAPRGLRDEHSGYNGDDPGGVAAVQAAEGRCRCERHVERDIEAAPSAIRLYREQGGGERLHPVACAGTPAIQCAREPGETCRRYRAMSAFRVIQKRFAQAEFFSV